LTDASYFNAIYKEAVELCAYLCKEYKLDPMADGTIIGHYEGYQRGIASNHADPRHWFSRHGKSMATFRTEVKKLLSANEPPAGGSENTTYPEKLTTGYYRVRKTWADAKSQLGAYRILSNAKAQVDKNPGYYVFNNDGMIVYPTGSTSSPTYKEYTVVKGDSLWAIAAKLLGSGTRYTEIVKLNNLKSTIIYTGQKLKIPN
jgi:LysM repeat protein